MFEKNLKKMQKRDPTMTEDELLRRIIEGWNDARLKVRNLITISFER